MWGGGALSAELFLAYYTAPELIYNLHIDILVMNLLIFMLINPSKVAIQDTISFNSETFSLSIYFFCSHERVLEELLLLKTRPGQNNSTTTKKQET